MLKNTLAALSVFLLCFIIGLVGATAVQDVPAAPGTLAYELPLIRGQIGALRKEILNRLDHDDQATEQHKESDEQLLHALKQAQTTISHLQENAAKIRPCK